MPPPTREQDAAHFLEPHRDSVTVYLPDLEPIGGLIAACTRLSMALTEDDIKSLELHNGPAAHALGAIQQILWRLEHARPESVPKV